MLCLDISFRQVSELWDLVLDFYKHFQIWQ